MDMKGKGLEGVTGGGGGGSSNRRGRDNLFGDCYEPRKEGRSRREERREERRRRERSNDHDSHHHRRHHHRRSSASPPSSPRVTILKHSETTISKSNSNLNNQQANTVVTSTPLPSGPSTPVHLIHSQSHQQISHQQTTSSTTLSQGGTNINPNNEETIIDIIDGTPGMMKLIDTDTWSFLEHPAADYLFSETQSLGSGGFTVVSAVGMQSVGKSSLLNRIARANVFKTHQDPNNSDSLLRHISRGIDLHATRERFLLLDSQPLMSASCLDEYIKNGSGVSNSIPDSSEPETNVYITSLQLLCFLLAVSDYVIVVNDWTIDIHLIKLIATAMMMVGNDTNQAELIFQVTKLRDQEERESLLTSLRTFLGGECFHVKEIIDENESTCRLIKLLARRAIHNEERGTSSHTCEKSWLINAQRYWENSIRKSTIYSDYARLML